MFLRLRENLFSFYFFSPFLLISRNQLLNLFLRSIRSVKVELFSQSRIYPTLRFILFFPLTFTFATGHFILILKPVSNTISTLKKNFKSGGSWNKLISANKESRKEKFSSSDLTCKTPILCGLLFSPNCLHP